jgi:phosphate transport system substrate-binding protein
VKTLTKLLALLAASVPAFSQILIHGAGATFPYPIYVKWFDEFHRLRPEAAINYQPIGSGGGLRQLEAGTVDFGATDCPISDDRLAGFRMPVLHFPSVVGGVTPVYNVPGVSEELNFTSEMLAGIFLGTVRRWNDAALRQANPGVKLPAAEIVVVHRADASGTTFVFTDFLSKTNAEWRSRVGNGMAVNWRRGLGARGNGGVAALVEQTPNSIGYVELAYALQNRMTAGRVRNRAGRFVKAGPETIAAAAASLENMPDDFRVSIVNAPGENAYPVASFTWLVAPARIEDAAKRRVIADFLVWMLTSGQKMAEPLGYAPLPAPVAKKALAAIARLR